MPLIPRVGRGAAGLMSGSLIAMCEAPVRVSMAQTTPLVESDASSVVGVSVISEFKNIASGSVAARLISAELSGELEGKRTR